MGMTFAVSTRDSFWLVVRVWKKRSKGKGDVLCSVYIDLAQFDWPKGKKRLTRIHWPRSWRLKGSRYSIVLSTNWLVLDQIYLLVSSFGWLKLWYTVALCNLGTHVLKHDNDGDSDIAPPLLQLYCVCALLRRSCARLIHHYLVVKINQIQDKRQ